MRQPELPLLEPIIGGLWWTVGALALDPGTGTVVLAGGLGLGAWLALALRRRHGAGAALPPGTMRKLLQSTAVVLVLVIGAGIALGALGLGELGVPLACAIVGLALFGVSSQLDARPLLAVGAAMLVLGAVGALLALSSSGAFYPQGLVGLGAAAALWSCAAHRGGLLLEARRRAVPVSGHGERPTAQLPLTGERGPAAPGGRVDAPTGSFSAWSAQQRRAANAPRRAAWGPDMDGRLVGTDDRARRLVVGGARALPVRA